MVMKLALDGRSMRRLEIQFALGCCNRSCSGNRQRVIAVGQPQRQLVGVVRTAEHAAVAARNDFVGADRGQTFRRRSGAPVPSRT